MPEEDYRLRSWPPQPVCAVVPGSVFVQDITHRGQSREGSSIVSLSTFLLLGGDCSITKIVFFLLLGMLKFVQFSVTVKFHNMLYLLENGTIV